MRFLALDFETGGQQPGRHGPVTLGAAVMEGEEVVASREWLFAPARDYKGLLRRDYDAEAEAIHGYGLERMERDGRPVAEIVAALGSFAREHRMVGSKVVAFNTPFDLAVYSDCVFLAGTYDRERRLFVRAVPPLLGPWHCALMLSVQMLRLDRYKLDDVAAHFGLARITDKHGAEEDSILAGRIYARLQAMHSEARKDGNVATAAEGPVADAQRRLAACPRGSAEYDAALGELTRAMKAQGAGRAA